MGIKQLETVLLITSSPIDLPTKNFNFHKGTNQGEVMLDIVKPPNEALMRLSYGEKKAIYGARRVRVGTQTTEGDNMFT